MNWEQEGNNNFIFKTIKNFENLFFDEFQKCDIKRCDYCNGTGLKDKHSLKYCSICGGMGYTGFKKLWGHYVCRSCNGAGCAICKNKGTVDWAVHATGRDHPQNNKPRHYLK